jgi:multimeric flavodoxin WrbA
MKKVTAFIGTQRRGATYRAVQELEAGLRHRLDVDFEYVFLDDYSLEFCRGCKLCFDKGEEHCPLKDDRDVLLQKMADSDGVVFATPNYAFQVSARMKNVLDRLAYLYHRPRFFGKTFTAVVVQGFYGGGTIRKYLEDTGEGFGFVVTKGASVTTLEPMTERQQRKISREMNAAAERFHEGLMRSGPPSPSLFRLFVFRMSRMNVRCLLDERARDFRYYREEGWLESDYYYDTSLGSVKKLAGILFDAFGRRMATHR